MTTAEATPVAGFLQNDNKPATDEGSRPVENANEVAATINKLSKSTGTNELTNGTTAKAGPAVPSPNGPPGQRQPPGIYGIQQPPPPKPLKVLVVGAGIAGLTAAASLRQMGHEVQLFEQSRFSNEVGAAIHVGPNASRLLKKLGYNEERLRGVNCLGFSMQNPEGKLLSKIDNARIVKIFQSPHYLAHRVDLHNELKCLALDADMPGPPATLNLAAQVVDVDAEAGRITLRNGETHQGDLIIAADGVHSRVREIVFDPAKPKPTGTAAYRFIVDADQIINDPECISVTHGDGICRIIAAKEKRIVVYPCRDSTLLNFVCLHEGAANSETASGWNTGASINDVLETYKDFSPAVLNTLKKAEAEKISCWQLVERDEIPSWVKGRVALVGDAAHPMLPHHGQGGGQAMEDGAALGQLFATGTDANHVSDVLQLYQQVRYSRASKVVWLSATQSPGKSTINPALMHKFIYGHDVTEYAKHTRSSVLMA